jgi:hypothetical protein
MKTFFIGLTIGSFIALFPILQNSPASSVSANWSGKLRYPEQIEYSTNKLKNNTFTYHLNQQIISLNQNGKILNKVQLAENEPIALSGNSKHYVKYQKLGKEIELYNLAGERFWKTASSQYPYLSNNAKLILLLVSDLSKIRILDNNGLEIGDKSISGRFCTSITFAKNVEAAAVGFLNGEYHVINKDGKITYSGKVPENRSIKSMALSDNAAKIVIHYGNTENDSIISLDLESKDQQIFKLPNVHVTKTALHITNNGAVSILNLSYFFIIKESAKVIHRIKTVPQRVGHNSISYANGIYATAYRTKSGGSQLIVVTESGEILLNKEFSNDSYLDCKIIDNSIIARGDQNLFCWNFSHKLNE